MHSMTQMSTKHINPFSAKASLTQRDGECLD